MVTLTLRELQAVCLDILIEFDRFCKKHGLDYCLCGGTLLGAVRHRGFIPWDDDIDIFMGRPDYERFIELCRTETIREDLKFACWQNGGLKRPFSRLYKTDTIAERKFLKDENHVWIDILPVDGMPEDPSTWAKLYKKKDLLNKFDVVALCQLGSGRDIFMKLRRFIVWPLAMLVGPTRWSILIERLARKQDFATSTYVGCITCGRYGVGEGMKREGFIGRTEVSFEGRSFPAPACWHEYLSGIYGDFMTPPEHIHYNQHMLSVQATEETMQRIHKEYAEMFAE